MRNQVIVTETNNVATDASKKPPVPCHSRVSSVERQLPVEVEVGLLTGGQDRHYAFGLAMALVAQGISLDVIGGDEIDSPEMHSTAGLRFLNLRKSRERSVGFARKVSRILRYYSELIGYSATSKAKVFHILWNNRFEYFDRTLLMFFYRLSGKKLVLTAHNVNIRKRDRCDSWLNRLTLSIQYKLADRIFVHTSAMKDELIQDFSVSSHMVSVIPYGINNAVPSTSLTAAEAKRWLGLQSSEKTILFFGAIAPYKGLDLLVDAFDRLTAVGANYRLIIAGIPKGGCGAHLSEVQQAINKLNSPSQVIQKIEYIPDEEIEWYFKAADLLVLPYRQIFQSGVLFLGYSFGLPVVATDVGAFRDDLVEGKTGFLCRPNDPSDLAGTIEKYFASPLFVELESRRQAIQEYSKLRHQWDEVGAITRAVYCELLEKRN